MMTKPVFASFLSQRSRSRSSAHFPDNRRSFSRGGAAAREQCADCCLLGSVGVTPLPLSAPHVWLLAAFTVPLDDGKGTASYRKYVAHFNQDLPPHSHDHDQDRRPLPVPAPEAEWPARKCVRTARVVTGTACSHRAREGGGREEGEEDKRI